MRGSRRRSTTRLVSRIRSGPSRARRTVLDGEAAQEVLAGEQAWIVGGAVRDELLGRPLVDLDIACREPEAAARRYARLSEGAPFPLSERHGAWRVALSDERTVDFALPNGIHEDLATRDFTINAIAPAGGSEPLDPFGGLGDLGRRMLRAVAPNLPGRPARTAARSPPRGQARLPAGFGDRASRPGRRRAGHEAGRERILAGSSAWARWASSAWTKLGLLAPLGGSLERLGSLGDDVRHAARRGLRKPARTAAGPNELRRYAGKLLRAELPPDLSPRAIHRFRRAAEPWADEAARFAGGDAELERAIAESRAGDPAEPLLRGDELRITGGAGDRRVARADRRERAQPGRSRRGRRRRWSSSAAARACSTVIDSARSRLTRLRNSRLRSQRGGGWVRLNRDPLLGSAHRRSAAERAPPVPLTQRPSRRNLHHKPVPRAAQAAAKSIVESRENDERLTLDRTAHERRLLTADPGRRAAPRSHRARSAP